MKTAGTRVPAALRVSAQALVDWWDAWLPLLIINLVAAFFVLLILPGPPAIFGLYAVANQLAHGRTSDLGDFLNAMRRYFLQSWLWMLPNLVIVLLALAVISFYGRLESDIAFPLQILAAIVFAFWLIVQFYTLPYLFEQVEKRLLLAWRNALFTALASPVYTLSIGILAALLVVLCIATVAPLFLGGASLLALFGTRSVFNRLDTFGVRERDVS